MFEKFDPPPKKYQQKLLKSNYTKIVIWTYDERTMNVIPNL